MPVPSNRGTVGSGMKTKRFVTTPGQARPTLLRMRTGDTASNSG